MVLPTLPPELIGQILSIAAAEARIEASGLEPIGLLLRQLALLSKQWREFGQSELLHQVNLAPGVTSGFGWTEEEMGGTWNDARDRGSRLIETLKLTPSLGSAVTRLTVLGTDYLEVQGWTGLLLLCPQLDSFAGKTVAFDLSSLGLTTYSFLTSATLRELILDEAFIYSTERPVLPSLTRLKLTDCTLVRGSGDSSWWGHAGFPKLETLAVLDQIVKSCIGLASTPTLRALIASSVPSVSSNDPPSVSANHILHDTRRGSLAAISPHPLDSPVHLRCGPDADWYGVFDELKYNGSGWKVLKTVYIEYVSPEHDEQPIARSVAKAVGHERFTAVKDEGEAEWHSFGYEHFIRHHSRPINESA